LKKKNLIFFAAVFFSSIFGHFRPGSGLDSDPYWIRNRIGIQHKMLDTDPDEMNADPQPCLKQNAANLSEEGCKENKDKLLNCLTTNQDL
jgi:hypothetical protein